jgi:3-dehydroquinate synthase
MIDQELVDHQRTLLERFGLPVEAKGVATEDVIQAMRSDKKSRGGAIRWVLLEGPGKATTRHDVPSDLVRDVIAEVVAERPRQAGPRRA